MSDPNTHDETHRDPHARGRDPEEPGASSGGESDVEDRTVPGTASAREGYTTEGGTAHDEALEGVSVDEGESGSDADAENGEPAASPVKSSRADQETPD